MKAVLISIHPEWCNQIENGLKTMEIRKSRPKISTPFKCYIYCTSRVKPFKGGYIGLRKVIGEFICDDIIVDLRGENADIFEKQGRISLADQKKYGGNKPLYGWHISNLVIYDQPKELRYFRKVGERIGYRLVNDNKRGLVSIPFTCNNEQIRRPPQSWCYVEALT